MLMWATVTDGRESRARSCLEGTLFYENSDRSEYTGGEVLVCDRRSLRDSVTSDQRIATRIVESGKARAGARLRAAFNHGT